MTKEIIGQEFKQNGKTFYQFVIPHKVLKNISFTSEFNENNQSGDQRPLNKAHCKQFAKAIQEDQATRPQSLVASLSPTVKIKCIRGRRVSITFPGLRGKYLRLVEGQHSKEAVEQANGQAEDWDWSVVATMNDTSEECQLMHSNINFHQKKPNRSVNAFVQYRNNRLSTGFQWAGILIDRLNQDEDSVLYGRVECFHEQKPVNGEILGFLEFVRRLSFLSSLNCIATMRDDSIYTLVKQYYNSWRTHFGRLWDDTDAYVVNKKMGFKVMTGLIREVFERTIIFKGKLTAETIDETIREFSYRVNKKVFLYNGDQWHTEPERRRIEELTTKLRFRRAINRNKRQRNA